MSGGCYSCYSLDATEVDWHDEELNAMWRDLMETADFSPRTYGGLLQSLDFAECADIGWERYQRAANAFKAKWMARTPEVRTEFYRERIRDYADRCKRELGVVDDDDE